MTPNTLKNLEIQKTEDVLDLKDLKDITTLDALANNSKNKISNTKDSIKNTIENPFEAPMPLHKQLQTQLDTLSKSYDWATEVPKTENEKMKQSEILNFLGQASSIAIALETQKNFSNRESKEANQEIIANSAVFSIDTLITNSENNSENISKVLEILQQLKNIKNPKKGSAAYIARENWTPYANAISKYTLDILLEKNKQQSVQLKSPNKKTEDFQWSDNKTGASVAAVTFIASQKLPAWQSIPLTLTAGLVGKSVQSYADTGNFKKTANHVFNDTSRVIKDGVGFIGDFLTNKSTTTSEKLINGIGSLALGAGAWWVGKKVLSSVTSLFTDTAKSVAGTAKNKLKEKIPEDSFFGKHWGKLSLLALSAFGLSKLPDGFWGNLLTQKGKTLVDTATKVATDTATSIVNKNIGSTIAETAQSQHFKERDVDFTKLNIPALKSNLNTLAHNQNKSLAEKAKAMLEQIQDENSKTSLIDDGKFLSSKDFKILATRAREAGLHVSTERVEKNKTYILYIGNMKFVGMKQDVIKQNNAIDKSKEEIDKYREEDKATLMINGMDRLIKLTKEYYKKQPKPTYLETAKKIKSEVEKNGSAGFTNELYTELKNLGPFTVEKDGAALMVTLENGTKYNIGVPPTVTDEAFDTHADDINKSTMDIISNAITDQLNDVTNTTMEQLLNNLLSDRQYDENDPVYKLLQEYKANLTENGETKAVTPEFFLSLGSAILERNKGEFNEYNGLEIAVDAGKAYIVFQGELLYSTAKQATVNILWNSWGTDEDGNSYLDGDAITKGATPFLFIGGLKMVDNIIGARNPGLTRTALRWATTKPMVFALYDTPKFLIQKGLKASKPLIGEKARDIYKGAAKKIGTGIVKGGEFIGTGTVNLGQRSIHAIKNPTLSKDIQLRHIKKNLTAGTQSFNIAKDYFTRNYNNQFSRLTDKIETLLENQEYYKGVKGAEKIQEKITNKLEKLEKKWNKIKENAEAHNKGFIQAEEGKLKVLESELNELKESRHLTPYDNLDSYEKQIKIKTDEVNTQKAAIQKIKDNFTPTTFNEAVEDIKKSGNFIEEIKARTMDIEKYLQEIDPKINSTRIELEDKVKERINIFNKLKYTKGLQNTEIESLKTKQTQLKSEIKTLKEQLHFQQENKINALSKDIKRLSSEKRNTIEKIHTLSEDIKQLSSKKIDTIEKKIELREAKKYLSKVSKTEEELVKKLENSVLTSTKTKIERYDSKLRDLLLRIENETDPTNKNRLIKTQKKMLNLRSKLAEQQKKWTSIIEGVKHPLKTTKKIAKDIAKDTIKNTSAKLSKEISTIIEKIPAEKRASVLKLAIKSIKTIGIAGTVYALQLIEDAENPYSAITKEATISALFTAGILSGGKVGGVLGAVGGGAIAAIATLIWGEDANKIIDKKLKKLETLADNKGLSKEYINGQLAVSASTDLVSGSSLYDITLGNIFMGDDAFEYFSDTNTQFKNGKIGKYLHRDETNLKYWNRKQKEEIQEIQEEISTHEKIFNSYSPQIKEQIQNEYTGFSKNELFQEKEKLLKKHPLNLPKIHYLQKELKPLKIETLQKKIIKKDSPWVTTQTTLFIATFNQLKKLENKNSVEYFTLLKKFIIQLQTYSNIGLLQNIMEHVSNNYPQDERKGIDLSNDILSFYTSILDKESELPQEIIQFLS